MAEMIGGQADFIALGRACRLFQKWQIDGGVTNHGVRFVPAGRELYREIANAGLRTEINLFPRYGIVRDIKAGGSFLGLRQMRHAMTTCQALPTGA